MVCIRCKMVVKDELTKLGLPYTAVELGIAEVTGDIPAAQYEELKSALAKSGLNLVDDKKSILVNKIKNIIIELVHYTEEPLTINFSEFLSLRLDHDYTYLANLFSEIQGITIEKYIIRHKIERVKELMVYNELNLTEIANLMHYSSVSHLSNQFKKMTGLTPSHFRQQGNKSRLMLDDV